MTSVTPIDPSVEVSDKGADDLYVELQHVIRTFVGRISNAEAIGMLEMLKMKVYADTHDD